MAMDKAHASDAVEVGVVTPAVGVRVFKCPICGSAMKEDQQVGWRICSKGTCRKRVDEAQIVCEFVLEARFPCPKCGRETKEHHNGMRICSMGDCRHVS